MRCNGRPEQKKLLARRMTHIGPAAFGSEKSGHKAKTRSRMLQHAQKISHDVSQTPLLWHLSRSILYLAPPLRGSRPTERCNSFHANADVRGDRRNDRRVARDGSGTAAHQASRAAKDQGVHRVTQSGLAGMAIIISGPTYVSSSTGSIDGSCIGSGRIAFADGETRLETVAGIQTVW